MPIAKNIRYCRKRAGLTQQQLADIIGVSKTTVYSWEQKKSAVPITSGQKVAKYFKYSFAEFCDFDIEKLDMQLSEENVDLNRQEIQNIKMFRALPDHLKQIIRYAIATAYEHNVKAEERTK